MKYPLVSILLVTYNCQDYLKNCLNSLLKISYPNTQLIVVDNNSTDRTKLILANFAKKITLIKSNQNLGYSGGNNLALKKAKGEFLFIINPDTKVDKNFLEPLVDAMKKDHQTAAAQPLVYLLKKPTVINLTGKVAQFLGFDWIRDYKKTKPSNETDIDSFSGSGVLIKTKVINEIGFYDQLYFMYYEDSDLSWRFRLHGYKIRFVPTSIIYHDYKYIPKESYQRLSQKLYYYERNRLITLIKNYSLKSLLLLSPAILGLELAMLVYFISKGWGVEKLRGYWFIILNRKQIYKGRRRTQRTRILSDKEIIKNFKAELSFGEFQISAVKYLVNPFLKIYFAFFRWFL